MPATILDNSAQKAVQKGLSSHSNEIKFRLGDADFVLVRIHPGEFDLGSPVTDKEARRDELPVRRVHITEPFCIGKFKVSQLQYKEVCGKNPSKFRGDELPVENIKYTEALEFCSALSKRIGMPVTLPTEAQWEYACRAGTNTVYYSGDREADLAKVAWYEGNSNRRTHKLGEKLPNACGLYDMLGDVWEPCLDALPEYKVINATNPRGEVRRFGGMMRGGGWQYGAANCRAATRLLTDDMFGGMGIRIVVPVPNSSRKP